MDASGLWPGKVVTEVAPAGDFWEAEPEHQDYLQKYPDGYTCHFPRPGWKLPKRTRTGLPAPASHRPPHENLRAVRGTFLRQSNPA